MDVRFSGFKLNACTVSGTKFFRMKMTKL